MQQDDLEDPVVETPDVLPYLGEVVADVGTQFSKRSIQGPFTLVLHADHRSAEPG